MDIICSGKGAEKRTLRREDCGANARDGEFVMRWCAESIGDAAPVVQIEGNPAGRAFCRGGSRACGSRPYGSMTRCVAASASGTRALIEPARLFLRTRFRRHHAIRAVVRD